MLVSGRVISTFYLLLPFYLEYSLSLSLSRAWFQSASKRRVSERNKRTKRSWGLGIQNDTKRKIHSGKLLPPQYSLTISSQYFDSYGKIIISAANQGSSLQKRVSSNIIGILSASKFALRLDD